MSIQEFNSLTEIKAPLVAPAPATSTRLPSTRLSAWNKPISPETPIMATARFKEIVDKEIIDKEIVHRDQCMKKEKADPNQPKPCSGRVDMRRGKKMEIEFRQKEGILGLNDVADMYSFPVSKCLESKCPESKCPESKCPESKCPEFKCPESKCPESKCPESKCPKSKERPAIEAISLNYAGYCDYLKEKNKHRDHAIRSCQTLSEMALLAFGATDLIRNFALPQILSDGISVISTGRGLRKELTLAMYGKSQWALIVSSEFAFFEFRKNGKMIFADFRPLFHGIDEVQVIYSNASEEMDFSRPPLIIDVSAISAEVIRLLC